MVVVSLRGVADLTGRKEILPGEGEVFVDAFAAIVLNAGVVGDIEARFAERTFLIRER